MPRIINPFSGTSPVADAISRLGQSFFGGTLDREINSQKLYGMQRQNAETDNLMNLTAEQGAAALATSPIAQAMIMGAGYDPVNFGKMGLLETAVGQGAKAPMTQNFQVGTGQPYDNTAGAFDAKLAETARNNDMVDVTKRYIFDNEPLPALDASGNPVFATKGNTNGVSPVLSDTERKGTLAGNNWDTLDALSPAQRQYLGANVTPGAQTPRNYVTPDGEVYITYDGITEAATGQPLPPGGYIAGVNAQTAKDAGLAPTNAVTTDLQSKIVSAETFIQTADAMIGLTNHPENFGIVGWARGNAQEIGQAAQAVMGMVGGEQQVAAAAQEVRSNLEQNGLSGLLPELYDPSLPAIDMLGGVLIYQGASVLAGQENRSVSDKDVTLMRHILGDPKGWFESAQSIRTKLLIAKAMAENHRNLAQRYLSAGMAVPEGLGQQALAQAIAQVTSQTNGVAQPLPPEGAAGAVPPGTATDVPPVTPEPQEGDIAINPSTGEKLVLRGGQWVPLTGGQ